VDSIQLTHGTGLRTAMPTCFPASHGSALRQVAVTPLDLWTGTPVLTTPFGENPVVVESYIRTQRPRVEKYVPGIPPRSSPV
jgi:hypothetical protein